jgi:enamine deaminase RidA (YjgF/YER057c/UK114 family)
MSHDVSLSVTEHGARRSVSTGAKWEPIVGYSRAVRVAQTIAVTGTVGLEPGGGFAPTAEAQARRALAIIQSAIEALGGRIEDVIRTRIFVARIEDWEGIARAHGEVFGSIRPATTLVQARLIDDTALVEIEADAIVTS